MKIKEYILIKMEIGYIEMFQKYIINMLKIFIIIMLILLYEFINKRYL